MEAREKLFDIENLCRICLEELQTGLNYDLLKVPELASKLFACASLKVEAQDGYPSRICGSCCTKLYDLHAFQVMCQESLQRFHALVESKKYLDAGTESHFVNIFESANTFIEELPFKEAMQSTLANNNLYDLDPLLSPKVEFETEVEECVFDMLENVDNENKQEIQSIVLAKAEGTASSDEDDDDDKPLAQRVRNEFPCEMWKEKLSYKCSITDCQRGFTTFHGLRLHVGQCHGENIEWLSCSVVGCDEKFPHKRQLNGHLTRVHKIDKKSRKNSYPCSVCHKVFCSTFSLKKHMFKHNGQTLPYSCNICEKRFVTNSALKDHLMRHAGIKNYTCPHCGAGKTTRQEWNAHLASHSNDKNFKCDLCSYASHNKQNLRQHVKLVHEKIRDYACQYCGKTFGKSNACKMHEMAHTGEKRCECKICGKRFLYAKSLTKHLKTHERRVLRAIEVYRKRQQDNNEDDDEVMDNGEPPSLSELNDHSKETHQRVADEILKVCAASAASIPKNPRLVERVEIEKLAGTIINPLTEVEVPSLSPQIDFMMKEGPHICPDCGQGFNGSSNMRRHHRTVHQGVKNFLCRFCNKSFAKSQTLKHHEMTHTGEKPNECKECGKRFIQRVALNRHMSVHSKSPETEASRKRQQDNNSNDDDDDDEVLDNGESPSLSELNDHSKETHQRVADEMLKVCGESAANIPRKPHLVEYVEIEKLAGTIIDPLTEVDVPSLSLNIDSMMKEGPYICPDCGQGFNGSRYMKRHHRTVHQGVKNFVCRFCNKSFAMSQTLKHHEMTHTGEKPNECKECGKRFIQRVALKRHMKVHSKTPEPKAPVVGDNLANPLE